MTPGNAENTSIGDKVSLKKAIYAKIEMWDGHSIVLPSRRLYDRLGCASINCEVYVEEDVHKLWKLVKSILDEKEKAALYSRSPKLKGIEGTDTVMRISVHDDSTGRLLGETKYSAEMLKSYKARMDKHSNFMSHGHTRELQGGSTDGRLEAEVRICQVKALMSPSIAYVNIRLESMKVFVNSFKHSFRVVVKCAGHALASQNYGGRLAIDFSDDAISSNVRIPIKSMHSEVEIEVYAKPNRKNDGHLELQGSFVVQRSLHDIESIDADSAIATRHAEKDALKTQNTLVAVEENASSKKPTWESCGGATLKIFDLLEIQANAVFADEIMGEVHMPSIKIPLKTKSGDIKGTLKAYIFVEENISTTGCLATFPNPVGRPQSHLVFEIFAMRCSDW